jgi:cobalamin synthase
MNTTMPISKNSLSSKFLYISLVGSLSVLLFAIIVFICGSGFSWLAKTLNFSSILSSLQLWQYLILVGLPVFFVANGVLYFSENLVERKFDRMLEKFDQAKVTLMFLLFLLFAVLVYFFGFNWYINFIYRTFWI